LLFKLQLVPLHHGPGVYAVSPQGPYEPDFGNLTPGYRDPMSVGGAEGAGSGGAGSIPTNDDPNGKAPEGAAVPDMGTSPPAGGYASADAARVGGGLYWHLLVGLYTLHSFAP
jgi:hypothetical protein